MIIPFGEPPLIYYLSSALLQFVISAYAKVGGTSIVKKQIVHNVGIAGITIVFD